MADSFVLSENSVPVIADVSERIDVAAGLVEVQPYEGVIPFADADAFDTYDVEVVGRTGNQTGVTFTAAIQAGPEDGQPGQIGWFLDVEPDVLNSLAKDQELTLSYTLRLTDGGGAAVDKVVTFTLVGANDAPTAVALSANTVAENAAGAVIGTLS